MTEFLGLRTCFGCASRWLAWRLMYLSRVTNLICPVSTMVTHAAVSHILYFDTHRVTDPFPCYLIPPHSFFMPASREVARY